MEWAAAILAIVFILLVIYNILKYVGFYSFGAKKKQAYETELNSIKESLETKKKELSSVIDNLAIHQKSYEEQAKRIKEQEIYCEQLNSSINSKKDFLNNEMSNLQETYAALEKDCQHRCDERRARAAKELEEIDANHKLAIDEKARKVQEIIESLESKCEDERNKYLSVIETIQRVQSDEEKDSNQHIKIAANAQEDISYLLNNVANRLSNPDILYKLIWSEYIQKPTNQMLDYVLPQRDCAGIYKITNDRNKKSYIGRSTSVRKRLSDHIKSSIGISTIADQYIHQVMREEGIWNFSFELIEECDKSKLNEREKYYISFFETERLGYNQKAGG